MLHALAVAGLAVACLMGLVVWPALVDRRPTLPKSVLHPPRVRIVPPQPYDWARDSAVRRWAK